jgi:hypothetical protein
VVVGEGNAGESGGGERLENKNAERSEEVYRRRRLKAPPSKNSPPLGGTVLFFDASYKLAASLYSIGGREHIQSTYYFL